MSQGQPKFVTVEDAVVLTIADHLNSWMREQGYPQQHVTYMDRIANIAIEIKTALDKVPAKLAIPETNNIKWSKEPGRLGPIIEWFNQAE